MMRHVSHYIARALETLDGPIKQRPHAGRHEAEEELTQIDCETDFNVDDAPSQRMNSGGDDGHR